MTGTRALEIAERLGDVRLRIAATSYLEQAHDHRGEYERVVELVTDNLAALPPDSVYEYFGASIPTSIYDRLWLVQSLGKLGRFAEAVPSSASAAWTTTRWVVPVYSSAESTTRSVWATAPSNPLHINPGTRPMRSTCSATSRPIPYASRPCCQARDQYDANRRGGYG